MNGIDDETLKKAIFSFNLMGGEAYFMGLPKKSYANPIAKKALKDKRLDYDQVEILIRAYHDGWDSAATDI